MIDNSATGNTQDINLFVDTEQIRRNLVKW